MNSPATSRRSAKACRAMPSVTSSPCRRCYRAAPATSARAASRRAAPTTTTSPTTGPPLRPGGPCDQCARGFPSRCTDYDYFGSRRDGAYAEYVNVPAANLLTCPEGMDPAAAAMTDPAAVALHAIWKARFTLGHVG